MRLSLYEKRKAHRLSQLRTTEALLAARARFVHAVISREIAISGTPRSDLDQRLRVLGFEPHIGHVETAAAGMAAASGAEGAAEGTSGDGGGGGAANGDGEGAKGAPRPFEYLLSMPIASLTDERVHALHRCDLGDLFI